MIPLILKILFGKVPIWVDSIRSISTLIIIITFCYMAARGRIEPKDFLLIVSLVCNFYFLVKERKPEENGGQKL